MSTISVPLGYRFCPTDAEIIKYLVWKISKKPSPGDDLLFNTNVFGEEPPWELFENNINTRYVGASVNGDAGPVRYFFTPLSKKSDNGSNYKRNIGKIGTWKGETKAVKIKDSKKGNIIGEKRSFTFRPSNNSDCKWLMMEYGLAGVTLKHKDSKRDYVVCRIKKKTPKNQENQELGLQDNSSSKTQQNDDASAFVGVGTTFTTQDLGNTAVSSSNICWPQYNVFGVGNFDNNNNYSCTGEDGNKNLLSTQPESAQLQPCNYSENEYFTLDELLGDDYSSTKPEEFVPVLDSVMLDGLGNNDYNFDQQLNIVTSEEDMKYLGFDPDLLLMQAAEENWDLNSIQFVPKADASLIF